MIIGLTLITKEFLKNFRGKLQTDGYSAYESLAKERGDLTLIGCWAHARRGFHFEYLKDLFTRLPAAKITEIKQFTPLEWAKALSTRLAPAA